MDLDPLYPGTVYSAWNVTQIIVGENKGWKQHLKMRKKNKQDFSYISFDKFKWDLEYLCEAYGIDIVFNEESYTSKASYLDRDEIPVYGEVDKPKFSGRRATRGNYKASNGRLINADLNGAANIGRKATGNFENANFNDCLVFKHPDYIRDRLNTKTKKKNMLLVNQSKSVTSVKLKLKVILLG